MLSEYNINQTTLKILGLYANDYNKSLHLRQIAREIGVDVKAVLMQLKRLEQANILSSAVKGRNREYTLNKGNIITRQHMVMAEIFASARYLQDNFLIKKVASEIGPLADGPVLLFGSFAKGQANKDSDIDLFFITDKKIDRKAIIEISRLLDRDINVQSAGKSRFLEGLYSQEPLMMEVVANHIVLKGADEFCDMMWQYYAR